MTNTGDEILRKFAESIKLGADGKRMFDPDTGKWLDLETGEWVESDEDPYKAMPKAPKEPIPAATPDPSAHSGISDYPITPDQPEEKPISQRDNKFDKFERFDEISDFDIFNPYDYSNIENSNVILRYPISFLHGRLMYEGTNKYRPALNEEMVKKMMDDIVEKSPNRYFRWGLYRKGILLPWIGSAARSFTEKDPIGAVVERLSRFKEIDNSEYLIPMWAGAIAQNSGYNFDEVELSAMRYLAGHIAVKDPDYYINNIYKRNIATPQHDRAAFNKREDLLK